MAEVVDIREVAEPPLGPVLDGWSPPPPPGPSVLEGRYARLERLTPRHAPGLWESFQCDQAVWTYLPHGPFADGSEFAEWVEAAASMSDPFYYAIGDLDAGSWGGLAALLAIRPTHGVVEVGAISFGRGLQRRRAGTEAMVLLANWAFGAGYRRYEWKCNALNVASRRAAGRLGFSYEGLFRQHMVQKGRTRDTAWFAITDADWPGLRDAWAAWLDPSNFDGDGRQRERLGSLTAPWRVARDPTG